MAQEFANRGRVNGNRNGHGNRNGNGGNGNGGNGNGGRYGGAAGAGATANEQIRDILHVLFKRKRLIGALFLAIVLPGLTAVALRKPSYTAAAKVMISTQRSDPTLQPTDLTKLETIQLNEQLVNSEVQVIGSRDLVENVVRDLASSGDGTAPPHVKGSSKTFGEETLGMAQGLIINPIKDSNVIEIDYKSSDPSYAARVVNLVVDEYLAYNGMVHGSKGLSRFYDEQQQLLAHKLEKAEGILGAFSEREGVVSPKDEIQAAVRAVGETTSALRDVSASVAGTEERIRATRDQIAAEPEVVKQSQDLEINPVISHLTTQLVERQVDRVSLLRKYTEKDRHVVDNGEEIAQLQAQLRAEETNHPTVVSHQLFRSNPVREDRLHTLLDLEGQLREMQARQAVLEDDLSRGNRQLLVLQQKSIEYDRLDQEVKDARDTYELYVKRAQEARVSQSMDEQKLVNVDVVQRPALPIARSDLQKVSVGVIIIAGLVIGIAGAFGMDYLSRSLRSESDVGRHLGLPLLASIADFARA